MLIKDEALVRKHQAITPQEAAREKQLKWAKDVWQHAKVLVDPTTSPTNWERQAGKRLRREDLENKLKKLNPNLHFEVISEKPTHKRLNILYGKYKEKICLYNNNDYIPEFSIFDWREEDIVDMDLKTVSRNDISSASWKGLEYDSDTGDVRGEGYSFNNLPGVIKVKRPWHELVRGWRTILAYLVHHGIVSVEAVEKEFGGSDRISWAAQTGRASSSLPFG